MWRNADGEQISEQVCAHFTLLTRSKAFADFLARAMEPDELGENWKLAWFGAEMSIGCGARRPNSRLAASTPAQKLADREGKIPNRSSKS